MRAVGLINNVAAFERRPWRRRRCGDFIDQGDIRRRRARIGDQRRRDAVDGVAQGDILAQILRVAFRHLDLDVARQREPAIKILRAVQHFLRIAVIGRQGVHQVEAYRPGA